MWREVVPSLPMGILLLDETQAKAVLLPLREKEEEMKRLVDHLFAVTSAMMLLLAVVAGAYHLGYRAGVETKVSIVGEKYKITLKEK